MFVCLCHAVTSRQVAEAVRNGASTTGQVAKSCGAGSDCGRCRKLIRSLISPPDATPEGRGARSATTRP
ncbi:MAG: (2Fe-2S)-binding protein [Mycobacterium sp.]